MNKLFFLLMLFPVMLMSFDGMIHLHVDNLREFYGNAYHNPTFKKVYESKDWNDFKSSKLYLRLLNDIKALDPESKVFDFKNIDKLPDGSMDVYLLNIINEKFVAKFKLDKSQSTALLQVDIDKLESIPYENKQVYVYKKLYFNFEGDYLYLSNNLNALKLYLSTPVAFETKVKKDAFLANYMYINMKKLNKTPYLSTYWFANMKSFRAMDHAVVHFKLNKKEFQEQGLITLNKTINEGIEKEKYKQVQNAFKINILEPQKSFQIAPFVNQKDMHIYQMVSNDFKGRLYLAKYQAEKPFKAYLKALSPSAKVKDGEVIEYRYGLLNKKVLYFKQVGDVLLMANHANLIKDVKLKENQTTLKQMKLENIKGINKAITSLSDVSSGNYVYKYFFRSYLKHYLSIKSFSFDLNVKKENVLEYNTKILF